MFTHVLIQERDLGPSCGVISFIAGSEVLSYRRGMAEKKKDLTSDVVVSAFKAQLPLQVKLSEVRRQVGMRVSGDCLDIGAQNPVMSAVLRQSGGTWRSVCLTPGTARLASSVLDDEVLTFVDGCLPFEDASFDLVVVFSGLIPGMDDSHIIEECHRVLRQDGHITITVPHARRWSVIRRIRRFFASDQFPPAEVVYTERRLFGLMKDGFDVHAVRTFSRFFVEFVRVFAMRSEYHAIREYNDDYPPERLAGLYRHIRRYRFPFWLAYQLDFLLFFSRGHWMVARGKRRPWIPRVTPVLVDGRSISEAVLARTLR